MTNFWHISMSSATPNHLAGTRSYQQQSYAKSLGYVLSRILNILAFNNMRTIYLPIGQNDCCIIYCTNQRGYKKIVSVHVCCALSSKPYHHWLWNFTFHDTIQLENMLLEQKLGQCSGDNLSSSNENEIHYIKNH